MGYNTWFEGQFHLSYPLTPEHKNYLQAFSEVRHMTWNAELLEQMEDDPVRLAVGLPIGEEGQYFTGQAARTGHYDNHPALMKKIVRPFFSFPRLPYPLDGEDCPPLGVPSLWCNWAPNEDGTAIQDTAEKFRNFIAWMHFLLDHFLIPWGYQLNGRVIWQGENRSDTGILVVNNNEVFTEARPLQEEANDEEEMTWEQNPPSEGFDPLRWDLLP